MCLADNIIIASLVQIGPKTLKELSDWNYVQVCVRSDASETNLAMDLADTFGPLRLRLRLKVSSSRASLMLNPSARSMGNG